MRPFRLIGNLTREAYKAIRDDEAAHRAAERKIERQLRLGLDEWVQSVLPDITEGNARMIAQQLRDKDLYFRDVLQDALTYSADLGTNMGIDALEESGIGFDYTLANVDGRDWARRYTNDLMRDLNVTNDKIVGESVSRWIENAKPIQELRNDIAQRVPGAYGRSRSKRAELIARTEVTRAIAEGNRGAYRASGSVSGMRWQTKNDEIVCPYCGSLNQVVVSVDSGAFFNELPPDLQAKLKGRTFEVPPAHPGCRCTISPVVIPIEQLEAEAAAEVAPVDYASVSIDDLKTTRDMEKWGNARYPNTKFDFKGTVPENIRPTMVEFDKLAQEWPEVAGRIEYVGTYKGANSPLSSIAAFGDDIDQAIAHASHDGKRIGLNPEHFGNSSLSTLRKELTADGWLDADGSIESLMTHEFGHHVDNYYGTLNNALINGIEASDNVNFGTVKETLFQWKTQHRATRELSTYATANLDEGFAEAFSATYRKPRSEWTDFVKNFDEMLGVIDDHTIYTDASSIPKISWENNVQDMVANQQLDKLASRLGLKR